MNVLFLSLMIICYLSAWIVCRRSSGRLYRFAKIIVEYLGNNTVK